MSSWQEAEQSEGAGAEVIPEGYRRVKVVKVMRFKRDGSEYRSEKGPKIALILADSDGNEAFTMLHLSEKAKNFLAKTLSRLGLDLAKMDEAKITLKHWEDEAFATKHLLGRMAWTYITHRREGSKVFCDVEWFHERDLPEGVADGTAASPAGDIDDENIPF